MQMGEEILAQPGTLKGEANRKTQLEAFGRENVGHLQHALVILLLLELGAGFPVDDESDLTMKLQCGGSDRGCKRSFNSVGYGHCLGGAAGEKENSLGFEDGADAHGDGALGNFFFSGKEVPVVFDGLFAKNLQTGSRA